MQPSDLLSLVAILVSSVSFLLSYRKNALLSSENKRYQDALFHAQRNFETEGRLAEWPEAFEFHGVDLEEAERRNISKEQIAYLVRSFTALSAICIVRGVTMYEELQQNDYRKRMLAQAKTREVWPYAKPFFFEATVSDVDRFLRENYSEAYAAEETEEESIDHETSN